LGVNPYIISTFLNSKHGQNQINRFKTLTGQPNINMSLIKMLLIPSFTNTLSIKIESLFISSEETRNSSFEKYTQAEALLLNELGLHNWQPTLANTEVKNFKNSFFQSGRLDAEYYQPKYDEIDGIVKNYSNGSISLKEFITNYSTGYPFDSTRYVDEGFDLIRINNIGKGNLDLSNAAKLSINDIRLSKKDIVQANDLLLSMSGTIGNCCKVPENIQAIINQRILRFHVQNFNPDVLCLIINSLIGSYQLERVGTGGVQTNISSPDIFKIKIPLIIEPVQQQIASLIQQSFSLKKQSEQLLQTAKQAVEMAIEEGEERAMEFIKKFKTMDND
jgi:restriction endonuclease S subunit